MRNLLVLVLCVCLTGCSLAMKRAPKKDPGTRPIDCSESMVPPGSDAVGAGALTLIGVASIVFKPDGASTTTFVVAEVLLMGVAAVFGYSGYLGYTSVKRCRAFKATPGLAPVPAGAE